MADLQELLSSISDEDMAKIKNVAASLMSGNEEKEKTDTANEIQPNGIFMPFDMGTMSKIMSVIGQMNKEDHRTRLISDLKPLLNEERRKKADEAIKFLQLMEILPKVMGMFGQ